jgi:biotin-dependent carboxylase-like uncharacterized protein
MSLVVLRPGALTTVQDGGRHGARHLGVGCAGALDAYSARIANLLVGNDADAALLEMTLVGPELRCATALRIAITGAEIDASLGGGVLPAWRTIDVPAGAELRFGACRRGARSYLALQGGLAVAPLFGSRATDLRAGFGGVEGRALRAGDVLETATAAPHVDALRIARRWVDPLPDLDLAHDAVARLLPGGGATAAADALVATSWRVSARSDRQGLRLDGPTLALADARERVSEPVAPGTVQLPPDGHPIVLLGDAQTCGGYPRIGHVASVDLARLAQCRAGDVVHFIPCTLAQAQAARCARQQRLQRIALALSVGP